MTERANHTVTVTRPNLPEAVIMEQERGLVEQAIARNPDAFAELYDRYADRVYRHVYYRLGKPEDAEDLSAQVFLKAWNAVDRYEIRNRPFGVWLLSIGHNLLIDHYRSRREIVELDKVVVPAGENSDPEARAEKSLANEELRKAIAKLKQDQRAVVIMRYIDGLGYDEIAQALSKSEGAVRVMMHRSLLALRELMGQEAAA